MRYLVTLEFNVTSTDLADVIIEASSPEEAKAIAISQYFAGDLDDLDFYASDYYESELDTTADWEIHEYRSL